MSKQHKVLIVDDEADIRELLEISLSRVQVSTVSAANLGDAYRTLAQEAAHIGLCLTDMRLPDGTGLELIAHLQEKHPQIPVAVITAYGSIDLAIESLKSGAFDFISKPIDLERLRSLVTNALSLSDKPDETDRKTENQKPILCGDSAAMQSLRQKIAKVARSQAPVYVSGESGSGKELVARTIHNEGARARQPFVPVNCGAIPSELMESEFFGHRKGSFTGAVEDKKGLFQAAHGGTLFLDEVADLPMPMQVKLLRTIQEKAVRPVGSEKEVLVDVRILSATHRDLAAEVEAGRFRQDLFYRINVIEIAVPALRERIEDIAALAQSLLEQIAAEWGMPVPELREDALQALQGYAFPGNVRELENILERAVTLSEEEHISAEHLQLPQHAELPATGETPIPGDVQLEEYLSNIERKVVEKALEETRWNRTAAAKKLGISFRAMRYRMKKLGIGADEDDGGA